MNFIGKLIANFFLKKELNKSNRKIENISFKDVKQLCVILPNDIDERTQIKNWCLELQKKYKIKNIEYVFFNNYRLKKRKKREFGEINLSDFNWYLNPKSEIVLKLFKNQYDMLINFEYSNYLIISKIILGINSKMKIGKKIKEFIPYLDWMIETKDFKSLFLATQIEKYISIFEKK